MCKQDDGETGGDWPMESAEWEETQRTAWEKDRGNTGALVT